MRSREEALAMLRRAFHQGLPDLHMFRPCSTSAGSKELGNEQASVAMFTDLAASPNAFQARAFEELAKFYEHHERNYAMALEMTRSAQALAASPEIDRRVERLRLRLAKRPPRQPNARSPPRHNRIGLSGAGLPLRSPRACERPISSQSISNPGPSHSPGWDAQAIANLVKSFKLILLRSLPWRPPRAWRETILLPINLQP